MPDEVVVEAGLVVGLALDRPRLRDLGRQLRRAEALSLAGRALARRDMSRSRLEARLGRARVSPIAGREALDTLARLGLVDDGRVARRRALELAERGWGDAAIALKLEGEGFAPEAVEGALAETPPEAERAALVAAAEPDARRAYRLLSRRGFGEDAIEAAIGSLDG